MKRRLLALAPALLLAGLLPAQEAIHSSEDLRYDFLALVGEVERPYLNYKTLSDSDWNGPEVWKTYGPELFTSYNSAAPYGMNDGALWQGKGLNTSLTGGARYAAHGFELTFKPQLTFSHNQDFDIMPSAYPSEYGYIWGYGFGIGADAPQRFGDDPLYGYSWGDSEIRYTWKKATIGFGTQSPWVGPGRVNAIMHSNNAPPYPKADIGLRRTPLTIFGHYLGDVEARLWAGYLSESNYFDENDGNDHNLISALSVAYEPSFARGLTLFVNRTYLAPWEVESAGSLANLFFVNISGGGNQDTWDQRASFGFNYLFPSVGFEVYGEVGINDYVTSVEAYVRYPFHSMVYTAGMRKAFRMPILSGARGELLFEWSNLELSQDFQFQWPATFYMHHQISQGYTNGGQWLGAGIGTGGNSQYLGLRVYRERAVDEIYLQRTNPDNDYLYTQTIGKASSDELNKLIWNFKATFGLGYRATRSFSDVFQATFGLAIIQITNPLYVGNSYVDTNMEFNFRLEAGIALKL